MGKLALRPSPNDYLRMFYRPSLEALEPRVAPATLVSPYAFTYTDLDGDFVKVTFSKPILSAADFSSLVNLPGGLTDSGPQDLIGLELAELGPTANGLNIRIVATPSLRLGGDGQISAVSIDAFDYDSETETVTGIDLGIVNVDGDLTFIDAGDADSTTFSIKTLTAKSMGLAEPGIVSELIGPVGTVQILGDFAGNFYAESQNLLYPDFKVFSIRGSILGTLGEDAGVIFANAGIDQLSVGGDIIGGPLAGTGAIISPGPILKINIKGSLIGGDGAGAGVIQALEMGTVSLRGSLLGGYGTGSGTIETSYGDITSLTIHGSILGGRGDGAANVRAGDSFDDDGIIGTILVKGSVIGILPDSANTAAGLTIRADNSIGKLTINGALINANIVAGVAPGADLIYGTGDDSQTLSFPTAPRQIGSLVIKGGVFGTTPGFSITALKIAAIQAGGPLLKPGSPFVNFDTGFYLGGGAGILVIHFSPAVDA